MRASDVHNSLYNLKTFFQIQDKDDKQTNKQKIWQIDYKNIIWIS